MPKDGEKLGKDLPESAKCKPDEDKIDPDVERFLRELYSDNEYKLAFGQPELAQNVPAQSDKKNDVENGLNFLGQARFGDPVGLFRLLGFLESGKVTFEDLRVTPAEIKALIKNSGIHASRAQVIWFGICMRYPEEEELKAN